MALLTVQYTAPLPTGFTSGTVELKSQNVYVDAAGRANQPYKKYTLGADKSLTSLQGDATPQIVGMGAGDPATAGLLDVIVTIVVTGLPTAQRSTFQVPALDTGGGTLNIHAPSVTAPVIGPYSPPVLAVVSTATDPKFVSATSSNPVNPTAGDLVTYPNNIYGIRFLASGAPQIVLWNRGAATWGDFGAPVATKADTDAATVTANSANGTANTANGTANTANGIANIANTTANSANTKAIALGDNLTLNGAGADTTGTASVSTLLTARLSQNKGRLGQGSYLTGQSIAVPSGAVLQGDSPVTTIIKPSLGGSGYAVQATPNPIANDYAGHQVAVRDLAIDGLGMPGNTNMTGLRMGGAHRTVENVLVKEFGVGVAYDQDHTYLNTLKNFSSHANIYGVVFFAGITDSGENIVLKSGAIFNNQHNLYIKSTAWFITLKDVSLDYPVTTQILVEGPVNLNVEGGHIENPASGVALLNAVSAGTDAGVIRFRGVDFVNSVNATNTVDAVVGPNIGRCTLVFEDCVDQPSRDRFSRVLWRQPGLPTAPPTTASPWLNNTGVTARFLIRYTLTPNSSNPAGVEASVGPQSNALVLRSTIYSASGGGSTTQLLSVDVPNKHYLGIGAAGATFLSLEIVPLPV